ncbi:MAG: ABC transporter ATP-binding protein [Acidobacteria bacterium]|nr:ABC transporter ATP-binding protein [Acidobacteriota bacterium]
MTDNCLETIDLTHRFADGAVVLDDIGLRVAAGGIYGFLGPNGAGKTTTLKLILGLLRKQRGEIRVFGRDFARHRLEILRRTGTLIESPSIYGHLTAAENLRVWRKLYDCPEKRIGETLALVGLAGTGSKRASRFSLGMKQRLSLAVALLHEPSLLILDEPTNGLDPHGIIEIRELLKTLNRERGLTILVSSHILSEIEKLATHVGIIDRGRLLFQGTLEELVKRQERASGIAFRTSDPPGAVAIFEQTGLAARIEGDRVIVPLVENARVARLNAELVGARIDVYEIETVKSDLERIFFEVLSLES